MKKNLFLSVLAATFVMVLSVQSVSAHEVHTYRIGNKTYELVVGSLNEPIVVDDKTGVDFRVREIDEHMAAGEDSHDATEGAVTGLDQTVKVEISAGDVKKTFDLSPVFGTAGAYKTTFYPTVQTTLNYRFMGTINNTDVDLTFACNPAGHPQTEADAKEVEVSDGVTRLSKRGAFGCAMAKADLGFPEVSASVGDLRMQSGGAKTFATTALVIAVVGFVVALRARRKPN